MALPLTDGWGSPARRTSLFYFTLFFVPAVANPFLPLWLSSRGIDSAQIGTIAAAPIFIMIVLNLVVGRLADRASDWRQVIIFGAVFAGAAPIALFFANTFWGLVIAWSLVIVPFQAISPVTDAAAMRMSRRLGIDFGMLRLWGTVGFILVTIPAGFLLQWYGMGVFVPAILVVSVLRALASLQLPLFRSVKDMRPTTEVGEKKPISPLVATRFRDIWRWWFVLPLVGAALLHGSHMLQMSFGALLWQEQGISPAIIGPLWAIAPVGEIVVMLYFGRFAKRYSARHLILLSCLIAVVRWIGFAQAPPIWGYMVLQFMHLGSFALGYMGVVNFIANWTTEDIAAQAQSAFITIRQFMTVVSLTIFGFLLNDLGDNSFYLAGGIALLGGLMVLISLSLMSPKREMVEQGS